MIAIAQAATAATGTFQAPDVQWSALVPLFIIFGAGVVGVLVEAFVPAKARRMVQVVLTLVAVAVAFLVVVWQGVTWFGDLSEGQNSLFGIPESAAVSVLGGSFVIDSLALLFQGTILAISFFAMLVIIDRTTANQDSFAPSAAAIPGSDYEDLARRAGLAQTEIFPLLMFAIGGMLIFPAAGDLLTMFIALEVLSLPLYVLTGMARRRRLLSQEASFKYFVLGAFSSAIFLFGAALLYGYSGTIRLDSLATGTMAVINGQLPENWKLLWLVGALMVVVGLLFKVGAVPFQAWAPDVYQGAPTPITGFMAACTKIAAFGALVRIVIAILVSGEPEMIEPLKVMLWVVAIATMLLGAVVGATQTDLKRMLGYSSIAHAGFVLVAILALNFQGFKAVIFYLLAYGLATVGAFGVITLVRETGRGGEVLGEATHLGQWAGLGRRKPWLAACFSVFLLSFAGIPLTAGFIGKFTAFSAAVAGSGSPKLGDGTVLVIVGVLSSAIAVFFYIRVIVIMFFTSPQVTSETSEQTSADRALETVHQVNASTSSVLVAKDAPAVTVIGSRGPTAIAIAVCALATIVLGVFPTPVLDLISKVTGF